MFDRIITSVDRRRLVAAAAAILIACLPILFYIACSDDDNPTSPGTGGGNANTGKQVFRFDTFGDDEFWTGQLHMDDVIESAISPATALSLGLKVDSDAVPPGILATADLNDPATTVALLKLDAVVGLKATVEGDSIKTLGVTCALCHSTVDDAVAPGIGHRKDGWPNHDLDVGKIIASSPAVPAEAKVVYNAWGPGMYDPRFSIDGLNTPLVIPPAYGLKGIKNETYTADGPISYWNAYVAVTQMHAHGTFKDDRLGINIVNEPDMVTPKLPDLLAYQLSLKAPAPPAGSFDADAAERGDEVFEEHCESCHVNDSSTDNNTGVLHEPTEIGTDPAYAARTITKKYRTTPLRGLWQHAPYFHDGSSATLADVVAHYNDVFDLNLTAEQQSDLVEYLKTL